MFEKQAGYKINYFAEKGFDYTFRNIITSFESGNLRTPEL